MSGIDPALEPLRFARQVADLEVDDAHRAMRMQRRRPAERCYIILFSARSGSSWLTSVLAATQRLGFPHEFLNPNMIRKNAEELEARTTGDVIAMLKRAKQSPNGVFGMEARAIDIELFGADAFAGGFAEQALFFHLWRRNMVAQAVSLYRAVVTRRFHSNSMSTVTEPPPYDAEKLLEWLRHVAATENDNVRLLQRFGIPARHLVYETITANRVATLRQFAHALAVPFTPADFAESGPKELHKVGDHWNRETEDRLRREHAGAIGAIERARLVRSGIAGQRPHAMPADQDLEQPWRDGRARGKLGRSPRMNPFSAGEPAYHAWLAGWRDGWDDQLYIEPARA